MHTLNTERKTPILETDFAGDLLETDLPMWDDFTFDEDWAGELPYGRSEEEFIN